MANTGRRVEITCLNVTFCVMVILLHLLSTPVTALLPGSWQHLLAFIPWKLFSVAVYGFIFLSGVKLFLPSSRPFRLGSFYLRRIRAVLIPYLIAVTVYVLAFTVFYHYRYGLAGLLQFYLLGTAASHFYFVIIILQFYALMPLWRYLCRRVDPIVGIVVLLFFQLLFRDILRAVLSLAAPDYTLAYQDRVFTSYIGVWICGCYAGSRYEDFLAMIRRNRQVILVCGLLAAVCNLWLTYASQMGFLQTSVLNLMSTVYVLLATLALYVLADAWVRRGHGTGPWLTRFDRISYLVFLYHLLVILLSGSLMDRWGTAVVPRFLLQAALTFGLTIPGCLIWQALKTRFLSSTREQG